MKVPYYVNAGASLVAGVFLGVMAGLGLSKWFGQPILVVVGLFAGVFLGGWAAFHALLQAGK